MPKTAPRRASKSVTHKGVLPKARKKNVANSVISVDDQLAEHLSIAEDALIAAITLFSGPLAPSRTSTYLERLNRAQEGVTALYREELVRIRGPLSKRSTK